MRTEVGYAGGTTLRPTYRTIGDHAEATRIWFDADVLPFATLLEMFWAGHTPTSSWSSQYRAALFVDDGAQLQQARDSARRLELELGQPVATEIAIDQPFYPAEGYHQKYRLRQQPSLMEALQKHFVDEPALLRSTAAAKLNGYVGGHATREEVQHDLQQVGLRFDGRGLAAMAVAG